MKLVTRLLQRELIVALGVATVWLIVFMVLRFVDNRLPWVLALGVTYGLAAYAVSPRVVRMGLMILQRKRVPSFTATRDGLPGDPVNLTLIGTLRQLRSAFARAWPPNVQQDWCEGDHWPVRGPAFADGNNGLASQHRSRVWEDHRFRAERC